jgi:ATP-dependent helicase HrpB
VDKRLMQSSSTPLPSLQLPIDAVIPQLLQTLAARNEAVLVAAPGAGKTTRVPLALLNQAWLGTQKILLLEPRRLAAKTAATRMAQLLGENVGVTVGYRMRLERKESAATKIIVVTEGVLTRMLQSDPSLDGIGIVIFDEFHERSLDADLGLALTLYSRELFRDHSSHSSLQNTAPLKVLVMSATLDAVGVASLLDDAPVIESEGRMFAVDVRYRAAPDARDIASACAQCVIDSVAANEGSLLVFLPGQREIRDAESQLRRQLSANNIIIAPLYGDLTLEQQQRAIAPADAGITKIVLATNIAETSITIDGVRVVIDCGFERAPQFDIRTAMTRLATARISRASATQRAGRAGRLMPGIAYRLWSEQQHHALAEFGTPEIRNTDLAALMLQLLAMGIAVDELRWLDAPPSSACEQALDLLQSLRACERQTNGSFRVSEHGARMAKMPLAPRLSHMLVRATEMGLKNLGCELAAILSDRDPLSRNNPNIGCDLVARIEWLRGDIQADASTRAQLQRARQLAKDFTRHTDAIEAGSTSTTAIGNELDYVGVLIALAYPDRIAQQRKENGVAYRLSNGRSASLGENDALRNCGWIAIADVGGAHNSSSDRIFLACKFDERWLESGKTRDQELAAVLKDIIEERDVIEWQDGSEQLTAEKQQRIGELIVRRQRLTDISPQQRVEAVIAWIRQRGIQVLPWSDDLRQWQARVSCLYGLQCSASDNVKDKPWPDISDTALTANLEKWLAPFLNDVRHVRHINNVDLRTALQTLLPWPLPAKLDELAPTHYTVPTGSHIRIDYPLMNGRTHGQTDAQSPPVLAVKLQEMFGEKKTPTIANGRIALLIHLLSPARQPLAITQDLVSFWHNAYQDVKKDMKGRYPKHPWPDDPLAAAPARGTKKREGLQ